MTRLCSAREFVAGSADRRFALQPLTQRRQTYDVRMQLCPRADRHTATTVVSTELCAVIEAGIAPGEDVGAWQH
jgi:hypothetical protein